MILLGGGLLAALLVAYLRLRSQLDTQLYQPRLAWLRAGLYAVCCALLAHLVGTFQALTQTPLLAGYEQAGVAWLLATALCFVVIVVAYAVIWPRGTFTDGRARHPLSQLLFGLAWGLAQGLLFLSFWLLLSQTGWATLWLALLAYLCIGGYNGLWHHFVWDIHVSPPHNYSEWNARKVLLCHTPNLLVSLSHLAVFGNLWVFLALQTLALVLSAWAMRFPAYGDAYHPLPGQERSLKSA